MSDRLVLLAQYPAEEGVEALDLAVNAWLSLPPARVDEAFARMRETLDAIDFDDLRDQLTLEGEAVKAAADRLSAPPSAATGGVREQPRSEPHLREVHLAILKELRTRARARSRDQLWDALRNDHGRDPIRDAIDELHGWDYVQGPPGSKRGVSLREAGRTALERAEAAAAPKKALARNKPEVA